MTINLNGYEDKVSEAVKSFWNIREIKGVRSGKTLDSFVDLIAWVVHNNGLPNAKILTGTNAKLPGFFRPTKSWDVIILNNDTLVGAIELKSIADSFGKNANNRNEEALGSGVDLKEAFQENAFEGLTRLFSGYLILVEDCDETDAGVQIQLKHFKVMNEFLLEPQNRDDLYIKNPKGEYPNVPGVSYMDRFDILCKRLMQKKLYSAACVVKTPRTAIKSGSYQSVSKETSIKSFLASLASHTNLYEAIYS